MSIAKLGMFEERELNPVCSGHVWRNIELNPVCSGACEYHGMPGASIGYQCEHSMFHDMEWVHLLWLASGVVGVWWFCVWNSTNRVHLSEIQSVMEQLPGVADHKRHLLSGVRTGLAARGITWPLCLHGDFFNWLLLASKHCSCVSQEMLQLWVLYL